MSTTTKPVVTPEELKEMIEAMPDTVILSVVIEGENDGEEPV